MNDVLVDLAVKGRLRSREGLRKSRIPAAGPPAGALSASTDHQNFQVAGSSTTQPSSARYGSRGVAQRRTSGLMKVTMYVLKMESAEFAPVGCVRLVTAAPYPTPS
jgi:hypothetical protein